VSRFYADGSEKAPHLGTFCEDGQNHRICGGWWCTCKCHDDWDIGEGGHVAPHVDHEWKQVDPCVYCDQCGTRLYQGQAPDSAEEKQAMAAIFDGIHNKIAADWSEMRKAVLVARGGGS
jgi:hypothetical protein